MPPAWQVQQLRLTVFAAPNTAVDYGGWWQSLLGKEPDEINQQPKTNLYQARGPLDDERSLVLQVQDARIDWYFLPPQTEHSGFLTVGPFPEQLGHFAALMSRWLPACPTASRFALAGVLLQPQPDKITGYQQLQGYLHSLKLDPASSDFSYQINRPRDTTAGVPRLQINRLTKWSVTLLRGLRISAGKDTTSVADTRREYACRLEFDINTSPDFVGPLPSDRLGPLLDEFASLTVEIAEKGDIP